MSDFFDRLEVQRRHDLQEIGMGALIGSLVTATIIKYTSDPTIAAYLPSVLGSLPGAAIVAGIIDHRQESSLPK